MKIYSLKAILLGWLATLGLLIGMSFLTQYVYQLVIEHFKNPYFVNTLPILLVCFIFLSFIAGGFITGKISKQRHTIHGLLGGALTSVTLLGMLYFTSRPFDSTRIASTLIVVLSPIPSFMFGAFMARKQQLKNEAYSDKTISQEKIETFGKPDAEV